MCSIEINSNRGSTSAVPGLSDEAVEVGFHVIEISSLILVEFLDQIKHERYRLRDTEGDVVYQESVGDFLGSERTIRGATLALIAMSLSLMASLGSIYGVNGRLSNRIVVSLPPKHVGVLEVDLEAELP